MKKIINLNFDEFKKQLIDFFEFTMNLSENFYKENKLKFEDFFDFKKTYDLNNNYVFLSGLHKGTGSAYFLYENYKNFEKLSIDDIFSVNFEQIKSNKRESFKRKEFLNFLKLFNENDEKLNKFINDFKIPISLKTIKNYLTYLYFEGDKKVDYLFGSALYIYLKKTNKLKNYIHYYKNEDIKFFKIHSFTNFIPYIFNIENFYNLILTSNPFFSEFISNLTRINIFETNFLQQQMNFKLSFIIFDYERYQLLKPENTYAINLNSYIRKKFEDDKIIKFYQNNRFIKNIKLFSFDKLKKISENCYKNFEILDKKSLNIF